MIPLPWVDPDAWSRQSSAVMYMKGEPMRQTSSPVLIVALLLFGAACLSGCQSPDNATVDDAFRSELIAMEHRIWDVQKRQDAAALAALLPEDAYVIEDTDGEIASREDFLAALPDLVITEYAMDDVTVRRIGPRAGVLTYRLLVRGSYAGQPFGNNWTTVSSIWVDRGQGWQNLGYQETPVKE